MSVEDRLYKGRIKKIIILLIILLLEQGQR